MARCLFVFLLACASSVPRGPELDGGSGDGALDAPERPELERLAINELALRRLFCTCATAEGTFENVDACLSATPLTLDEEAEIRCVEQAFEGRREEIAVFNCRVESFENYVACLSQTECAPTDPTGPAFQRCSDLQREDNRACGSLSEAINFARRDC